MMKDLLLKERKNKSIVKTVVRFSLPITSQFCSRWYSSSSSHYCYYQHHYYYYILRIFFLSYHTDDIITISFFLPASMTFDVATPDNNQSINYSFFTFIYSSNISTNIYPLAIHRIFAWIFFPRLRLKGMEALKSLLSRMKGVKAWNVVLPTSCRPSSGDDENILQQVAKKDLNCDIIWSVIIKFPFHNKFTHFILPSLTFLIVLKMIYFCVCHV